MKLQDDLMHLDAELNSACDDSDGVAAMAAIVKMTSLSMQDQWRRGVPLKDITDYNLYMDGWRQDMEEFPQHYNNKKWEDVTAREIALKSQVFLLAVQAFHYWMEQD